LPVPWNSARFGAPVGPAHPGRQPAPPDPPARDRPVAAPGGSDVDRHRPQTDRGRPGPGPMASGSDRRLRLRRPQPVRGDRTARPVRDRVTVDAAAWVRPMTAILDEYPRCAFVLADRGAPRVWELSVGDLHECPPGASLTGFDVLVVGGRDPE